MQLQLKSTHLPIDLSGYSLTKSDLPSTVTLPVAPHDIEWADAELPEDADIETATGKTVQGYSASDKSNWINDAIAQEIREQYDWSSVREERDRRLDASDWYVARHRDQGDMTSGSQALSGQQYQAILAWRQDLRDITDDFATAGEVSWPLSSQPDFVEL